MKAQTMFMSWVGTQAVPNRQSSSCSSLRTRALRWSCRRQNEINRTAYQLRVCVGDQHFEKEIEEMKESTFKGVGGLNIFTRSWQPEGKTRGVVVIVPDSIRIAGNICGSASNSRRKISRLMRSICAGAGAPKASVGTLKRWKIIPTMWRRWSEPRNRKIPVYRCSFSV